MEHEVKEQEGEREKEGGNLDILLHVVHLSPRLNHTGSIRSILLDTAVFCNPVFPVERFPLRKGAGKNAQNHAQCLVNVTIANEMKYNEIGGMTYDDNE